MNALKNVLLWLLLGMIVGLTVATFVAPGLLAWNNTPGEGQALCDCVRVTRSTARELIKAQLIGAGGGALVFLVLRLLLLRGTPRAKPTPP